MKKTYMQPEMLVEGMELEEMIAATTTDLLGGASSQNLNSAPETEALLGNLAREMSWFFNE